MLNVIFIIDRHILPGAELDVRVSLLRTGGYATGTGNSELRSPDRARRGLLRSVLPPWEKHQTAYFEQARSLVQERARAGRIGSARAAHRADHRHQLRRYTRGPLHHLPPGGRRSALRGTRRAAQDASVLRGHGRRPAQRPLGAAPQVLRLRLHRLPRRAGPRPGERLQPRRGRILARSAAGLRDAGQLAQGFRAAPEGQGVHGGQLRAVPHRARISPARRT